MKELRIGIVGCGGIGSKRLTSALSNRLSQIEIVADLDSSKANQQAKFAGCRWTADWREVVGSPSVDAVVVSTTNDSLAPIALSALENDKHVFCEKPLSRDVTEAEPLVETARRKGLILKVGFTLRHHPAIAEAHRLFTTEAVGAPMFIRCVYGHGGRPGYDREWRADRSISGGGELLDQGIHVLDLFRWFLGDFQEIYGLNISAYWEMKGAEDNAFAVLKTADDKVASMHVSCTQWKNLFRFEAYGRKGSLQVDGLGGGYGSERLTISLGAGTGRPPEEKEVAFDDAGACWVNEWEDFVVAIAGKGRAIGDGADALAALGLVSALYESDAERRIIRTPYRGV
ncbi:MAG: Gfo/Idh/MocA family oxidoreductase [Actinobacteria bacterium]|nr:Gfo/Idh/MocA family oxidoreductase [Actinomycetota bacterium]